VKHLRCFLFLLLFALVLTGCGTSVQEPYEYSRDGWTVTVYPEESVIREGENIYLYTIEDQGSRVSYDITFPDGSRYHWTATDGGGMGGWSEDFDENQFLFADFLVDALKASVPQAYRGHPILALILLAVGIWQIKYPETLFYVNRGWMFREAEPSDAYLAMTRVGGGIVIIVGVILFFV
jgi:hypothetical protein